MSLLYVLNTSPHSTLYKSSRNISTASFSKMLTKTVQSSTLLDCAHRCLYWETVEKLCNSFHYEASTETCQLASLTFLEDPRPGETSLAIMLDTSAGERLELRCRGGERCCVRNEVRLCGEGEGDCHHHSDCAEGLVCGLNNCNKTVGLAWSGSQHRSQSISAGRTVGPRG